MKQLNLFTKLILSITLISPVSMHGKFSAYSQAVAEHRAELANHQSLTERLTQVSPNITTIQASETIQPQTKRSKTSTQITIELIDQANIQEAQQAYTKQAQWAPIVKYALLGAGASFLGYVVYKWWTKPTLSADDISKVKEYLKKKSLELPTKDTVSNDLINKATEQIEQKLLDLSTKEAVSQDDIKKTAEYLKKENSLAQSTQEAVNKNGGFFDGLGTGIVNTTGSIGSFLATQASLAIAMSIGTYGVAQASKLIPTTGNLDWYIMNRTAYAQNITYLKQSFVYYAIFKESVATTAQLLMRDIEKILGYLAYCTEITFIKKSPAVQMALHDRTLFIEEHANNFAQLINDDQPLEKILAAMTLLETDIANAIKFIGVYS